MTREADDSSTLQILVALDTRSDITTAMRSAAALAVRMRAELLGMFVEDTDLLRIADLPFAHEIMFWSARERRLTGGDMARSIRALAARAQAELERTAQEARVHWSFRVQRGPRLQLLMEAGGAFDIVFVPAARRSPRPGTARCRPATAPAAVYTLFTGSPASERSLSVALAMVGSTGGDLAVLVTGSDAQARDKARTQAIERLKGQDAAARFFDHPGSGTAELAKSLAGLTGSALFLPADLGLAGEQEVFRDLLERIECPVVLVR